MAAKVVDASVLGAIMFNEQQAAVAQSLIEESNLYAPQLLVYELTHITQKKSIQFPAQRAAFEGAMMGALSMDIHLEEVDQVATLQLALATGLSTYDAAYLYLSRSLGAPLVTFDEKLQASIAEEGR